MNFGSDNQSGASPKVLQALVDANQGFTHGYGEDQYTQAAVNELKDVFDCDLEAFFVPTGTAANCLALSCLVQPWQTILCHPQAHIIQDENTAPELLTGGARLKAIPTSSPKISHSDFVHFLENQAKDAPHNSIAGALSLTQSTEYGQVYQPEEIATLTRIAHEHDIQVHMDGARFTNALAHLQCHPKEISWQAGVDVLCLGATKNGALTAETVIFFDKDKAATFEQRRKRAGHLISKGRLFGAQISSWLSDNHWIELATHANAMAQALSTRLTNNPRCRLIFPVEANEVFVILSNKKIQELREQGAEFYEWPSSELAPADQPNNAETLIRLVTSFQTTAQEVDQFCSILESNQT